MSELSAAFVDVSGRPDSAPELWPPLLVSKAEIDREIERLADLPRPSHGSRSGLIVHPSAREPGLGFAPGVDVTVKVLKPGEASEPVRGNANQLDICIGGRGVVAVEGRDDFQVERWDVWNLPSMNTYSCRNAGPDLLVRLSYSNAPLLKKLGVHYVEVDPAPVAQTEAGAESRRRDTAANFQIGTGAWLRGYEYLVDIDVVENRSNHWPWREVEPPLAAHSDKPLGMFILYNPATERRNGTTPNFFATLTHFTAGGARPNPARGHRHISSAINYHLRGSGYSIVEGERVEWGPGDLLLSAPGWSEHAHYTGPDETIILTVQDHPLHISMGSLLWQETMTGPILNLGTQKGFNTSAPRGVG